MKPTNTSVKYSSKASKEANFMSHSHSVRKDLGFVHPPFFPHFMPIEKNRCSCSILQWFEESHLSTVRPFIPSTILIISVAQYLHPHFVSGQV
mmetsp:Transcript_10334/g.38377  ORF Transcript_10334/g.38377 Transcript_10334/m.38377 type:complete len:93 (-) Transcript_10334:582-860(-)